FRKQRANQKAISDRSVLAVRGRSELVNCDGAKWQTPLLTTSRHPRAASRTNLAATDKFDATMQSGIHVEGDRTCERWMASIGARSLRYNLQFHPIVLQKALQTLYSAMEVRHAPIR